jgi:hypothetical protein
MAYAHPGWIIVHDLVGCSALKLCFGVQPAEGSAFDLRCLCPVPEQINLLDSRLRMSLFFPGQVVC